MTPYQISLINSYISYPLWINGPELCNLEVYSVSFRYRIIGHIPKIRFDESVNDYVFTWHATNGVCFAMLKKYIKSYSEFIEQWKLLVG